MTEIKSLYDQIYSENAKHDSQYFIEMYETNKHLFESIDCSLTNPDYDGILRITSDYALSLSSLHSPEALQYLERAAALFKKSSHPSLGNIPLYESLLWTKGVEYYNQKKYALAERDFKELVDLHPGNNIYKNWFGASRIIRVRKIGNLFWLGALVSLVGESLTNEGTAFNRYSLICATALFVFAIIAEASISIIKFRTKRNGVTHKRLLK